MRTILAVVGVCALALAGCSASTTTAVSSAVTAATPAVVTLAGLAAANSTTVAGLVTKGQLFCNKTVAGADSDVVALSGLATTFGVPYASVIGAVASDVAKACAAIGMVPVPAPATVALASVPVVATPAAAVLAPAKS